MLTEARRLNSRNGWTVEVRYDPQSDYIDDAAYTRVEGIVLSEAELVEASRLGWYWATADADSLTIDPAGRLDPAERRRTWDATRVPRR